MLLDCNHVNWNSVYLSNYTLICMTSIMLLEVSQPQDLLQLCRIPPLKAKENCDSQAAWTLWNRAINVIILVIWETVPMAKRHQRLPCRKSWSQHNTSFDYTKADQDFQDLPSTFTCKQTILPSWISLFPCTLLMGQVCLLVSWFLGLGVFFWVGLDDPCGGYKQCVLSHTEVQNATDSSGQEVKVILS